VARDECGSAAVRAGLGTMADMSERLALRRTTMRRVVGVAGAVALAATTWGWPSNAVALRGPDGGEINGLPAPRENVAVSLVLGAVVCTGDPGWFASSRSALMAAATTSRSRRSRCCPTRR
jgi:hypothetical protein